MKNHFPQPLQKLLGMVAEQKTFEQLTRDELAYLAEPTTLLFALPFGMTMPDEAAEAYSDTFLPYFDFMANELRIQLRNGDAQEMLPILNSCLLDLLEGGEINLQMAYSMVKVLKSHQLPIERAVLDTLGELQAQEKPTNVKSLPVDPQQMLDQMAKQITQQGIDSGFAFCQMISDELAVYPVEGVKVLLSCFLKQKWIVDALLLLSLHKESEIASVAAELLNDVADKQWKFLTNRNYLLLVQRFADEKVKAHLPKWNRLAMQHAKQSKPSQVVELYAAFADGQHSTLFLALVKDADGKHFHQVGGVFRLGYGLVDSYFSPNINRHHFQHMVETIKAEVGAIPCDPLLLRHLFPWALHEQQASPERMSVDTLQTLALLPSAWSEPQAFNIDHIAEICHFDAQQTEQRDRGRKMSRMLLSTPMVDTWLVHDIDPTLTKARQVRDHCYLAQPQRYIEALSHAALLAHFSLLPPNLLVAKAASYLACAFLLQEGGVGRKAFPLFDWLAEESLHESQQDQQLDKIFSELAEPTGYVLKVQLMESKPKVWRRFTVSSSIDMHSLHNLLQDVMGWDNYHGYTFLTQLGNIDNSSESPLPADDLPLMAVLRNEGDSMGYVYDFGDHWQHTVVLEKINKRDCWQPKVTAGNGACPPEDCGGIWGYNALLEAAAKAQPSQEEQEQLEWYGMEDGWDAKAFKNEVNELLGL